MKGEEEDFDASEAYPRRDCWKTCRGRVSLDWRVAVLRAEVGAGVALVAERAKRAENAIVRY